MPQNRLEHSFLGMSASSNGDADSRRGAVGRTMPASQKAVFKAVPNVLAVLDCSVIEINFLLTLECEEDFTCAVLTFF